MLLMIDNYDSFTYNLVHYLADLGVEVVVRRNDAINLSEIEDLGPDYLMLSPGPCTPDQAGISLDLIRTYAGRLPIFGVCLGHQSIGQAMGGRVVHARKVMHGKTSAIHHNGSGAFAGLPSPFQATRYHSLVLEQSSLPADLEITAWTQTEDGKIDEIMAVRHRHWPVEGVQFHPESILSEQGHAILANILRTTMPCAVA